MIFSRITDGGGSVHRKLLITSMLALLAVVVLMASSGVQAVTSQRALQAPPTTVQTKVVTPAAQQAALGFWTHDRIAASKPLPMPVDRGSAAPVFASDQTGSPGLASAGAPAPGADAVAQRAYPQDWAAQGGSGAAAAPPRPRSRRAPARCIRATSQTLLACRSCIRTGGSGGSASAPHLGRPTVPQRASATTSC